MIASPETLLDPQKEKATSNIHDPNSQQKNQANDNNPREIINLDSSEEKQVAKNQNCQKRKGNAEREQRKLKMKKPIMKCVLCKGSGKRSELKTCVSCKFFFHINCLDEGELKKKYVCDRCRIDKMYKLKAAKKLRKNQEKSEQIDKNVLRRLEREKKREECARTLNIFNEKYSYYMGEDGKIKYPIEDKLLFIYRQYFDPAEMKVFPSEHEIIPSIFLGDFMEIQNFLVSFREEIRQLYNGKTKKNELYHLLNCEGMDETFLAIIVALIRIYLKDIYSKNKTENVKYLNDHEFFITLGNLIEVDRLSTAEFGLIIPEIVKYLIFVPSMKKAFDDFVYPTNFSLPNKLFVLTSLIKGLSETDAFHEMVSKKSQKMAELTREKGGLVTKLKKDEAEVLSNREKIKEMMLSLKDKETNRKIVQDLKFQKEFEKQKKKAERINEQCERSEKSIQQLREKLAIITKTIPFSISEVMFLGIDRNKSKYFFYCRQPDRIYVQHHNFLLDENPSFKIYQSKEKIIEFQKSLNTKGINQKHLYESINYLLKDELIEKGWEVEEVMELQPLQCQEMVETEIKKKIIEKVLNLEQKFTNFLFLKNYQWISQEKREQFRFGFEYIQHIQPLKEAIKNLHEHFLFVQVIRDVEKVCSDSNEEKDKDVMNEREQKKRKPIRLWGINTEKIKKFWVQYLEGTESFRGIWICTRLLDYYLNKYVQKKIKSLKEEEMRMQKEQLKKEREMRMKGQEKSRKQKRKIQIKAKQRKSRVKRTREVSLIQINEGEKMLAKKPNLRKQNRQNKPLIIDSSSNEICHHKQVIQQIISSDHEGQCEVCHEYGNMICCDTCPKLFHLECLNLKEIPEGEWNCLNCLQRMANVRQTRSMKKYRK